MRTPTKREIRAVQERALDENDANTIRLCALATRGDQSALDAIGMLLTSRPLPDGVVPKRGRRALPKDETSGVRVPVYLTPAQLAQLDHDRGAIPRSAYLARRAGLASFTPLYTVAPGPGTVWFAEAISGTVRDASILADHVRRTIDEARAGSSLDSVWEVEPVSGLFPKNGQAMVTVRYVRCVWVRRPEGE